EDMLSGLPPPVQLWLNHAGAVGKEMTSTVRLKQTGLMRMSPDQKNWVETNAEQYFTINQPAFIWKVKINMMSFIPVVGKDEWIDGRGQMNIRVFSLYNMVNQAGFKSDQGALQRCLAEIVWFPSAALSSFIKWESINSLSAKATISYKGVSGSVVFHFSEQGDVMSCSA